MWFQSNNLLETNKNRKYKNRIGLHKTVDYYIIMVLAGYVLFVFKKLILR